MPHDRAGRRGASRTRIHSAGSWSGRCPPSSDRATEHPAGAHDLDDVVDVCDRFDPEDRPNGVGGRDYESVVTDLDYRYVVT
jgi:hypothetical protein